AARHASSPPGWHGDGAYPTVPHPRAEEPRRAASGWWVDAPPGRGPYSPGDDGSYPPVAPADAGHAPPRAPGGYGQPTSPADHGAPEGAWSQAQATHRYRPVPDPEPSPFDLALPDLRNKVVDALIGINWNHATQAWQRRRRDPLNQHVLVFFFAEPPNG